MPLFLTYSWPKRINSSIAALTGSFSGDDDDDKENIDKVIG